MDKSPTSRQESGVAQQERRQAILERDAALTHIEHMRRSRSWRLTRPLRMLLQWLRHGKINGDSEYPYHHAEPLQPLPSPPVPASDDTPAETAQPLTQPRHFDLLCFANIDWSARFQRPQQLMSQFAAHGYRVFYIILSPSPLADRPYCVQQVAPGVFEVCLRGHSRQDYYATCITEDNLQSNARALQALVDDFQIRTAVSVVHLPYWTRLVLHLRQAHGWLVQYDCMDEWQDFPNIGKPLLAQEQVLVEQADLVTVTAAVLQAKWARQSRRCLLVRNGVDFDFFASHCSPNSLLADLKGPVIGFYGGLAEWVDFELLAAIARLRPQWNLVLIGDVFVDDLAGLDNLPNVHLLGRRAYAQMPQYLYRFDVCIIPFRLYDVTHAVDPVKFYEYISAGKPVVSVPLLEMQIYAPYVYFAEGPTGFVTQIEAALGETDPERWKQRIALARDNDWRQRFEETRNALVDLHPKVSVIIVTYNNVHLTQGCIDSLLRNTLYPNVELIVVDNNSRDDTRNYLRYLARTEPRVSIVFNQDNLGFAAANNQGLRLARGHYLVLLNNDTVVPKGWLAPLLRHLDDPQIGLVGPTTNAVGNEAKVAIDYNDLADLEAFADRRASRYQGRCFDIPMLAMFCVALRRDVLEQVGWLDETFGIGMFEDDDYSRRIQAAGLRTVCAEDSFIHHYGQASFKHLIASGEYQRLWEKNQAYFESKWGTWQPHVQVRRQVEDRKPGIRLVD
ncbi:glycosyltransferase [Pseudomonas sp. PH1b]|uniref:glycosyltransferase n=1 Tax=Pseudomonas sp. PH1b TaxID=1397282 RepID=UPI0004692360|nr:glycosyltransferase [Pseudomonas sp. PH1b]